MLPPNDQRNLFHKRIIGAAVGFLTGGPTAAIGGFARGGGGGRSGGQPVAPSRALVATRGRTLRQEDCAPGTRLFPDGHCHGRGAGILLHGLTPGGSQGAPPGGAPFTDAGGVAITGQYGAALTPVVEDRMVRTCLPGMVLGKDGNCYNHGNITNKERRYPKGTRPLGTPGEMAALRKAASFGRRMETTVKRMQKIGVLKKPAKRTLKPTTAAQHHAGG